jgi:hypothetical protein
MNLTRTWFARRPAQDRFEKLGRVCILQFFPGLGRQRFDSPLQAAGNAILAGLWHQMATEGSRTLNSLPFRGYTAEVRGDGLYYGGSRGCEFVLDLMVKPGARTAKALNPDTQAGLLQRGLTMLRAANGVKGSWLAEAVPMFPEIMVASPTRPEFEVTPMLRKIAARRLGVELENLDQAVGIDQYLPQLFAEFVREPHSEKNDTSAYLIPAVFTSKHTGIFTEDFRDLLGVKTFNPTAMLLNPAAQVMRDMQVTPDELANVEGEGNRCEAYMQRFRAFLGEDLQAAFTDHEIYGATVERDFPLITAEGKTVPDIIGEARFLAAVRKNMTDDYRELVTDDELRAGIADPKSTITLTGVCRPQAIYLQNVAFSDANHWRPDVLETATDADLWVDRLRTKEKRVHGRRDTAVATA